MSELRDNNLLRSGGQYLRRPDSYYFDPVTNTWCRNPNRLAKDSKSTDNFLFDSNGQLTINGKPVDLSQHNNKK